MNKQKIAIGAIAAVTAITGVYGIQRASAAETTTEFPPMIQKMVEKFNLNKTEVKTIVDQERTERQAEREADLTKKIDELVSSGEITADQKKTILAKHEEMQTKREAVRGLTGEERHTKMQELRTEMQNFLKEQGINESLLRPEGGRRMGGGRGMHRSW